MKSFTSTQWIVILILSLLTALEPLSIDLYLPAFILISDAFNTSMSAVQISLSTFLAGFAIGQLLWGPLADRFGRKKPIIVSLLIFIIASIVCMYVNNIQQLWVVRFIQALGGCGGVVISRAVVTDYFDKTKTLKIYSLLAVIMGVAPIIAPTIGNMVLSVFSWKGSFATLAILGSILLLCTLFFLPETYKNPGKKNQPNVLKSYWEILKVKKFLVYSIIGGIANGALMLYVSNGPFLIMEKGGFSNNMFSLIFGINAMGLMVGSYLTTFFQKYITTNKIVKYSLLFMFLLSIVLLGCMYFNINIYITLITLFFYVFPIGILFSTTTELAMISFRNNSGTASALFGSIQLTVSFICTIIFGLINNGSVLAVGLSFFICSFVGVVMIYSKFSYTNDTLAEEIYH